MTASEWAAAEEGVAGAPAPGARERAAEVWAAAEAEEVAGVAEAVGAEAGVSASGWARERAPVPAPRSSRRRR